MPTKRKWFDLKTSKGWIETAGAVVAVLGSAVGIYLQLFPKEAAKPDKKPETGITFNAPVSVEGSDTTVVGSQNVTVNINGFTIEQYQQGLKARDEELREAYKAVGRSEEQRKTIERELQAVQGQLGNLGKSYEERLAELKRLTGVLETLRGKVPDAKLKEALEALKQGKTKEADVLLGEIESSAQPTIDIAARAAFERGNIAYQEVRWQEARTHFDNAVRLSPDNAEYIDWAARLARELGDYPAAEPLYKKAIAINEKALPADQPALAMRYNNLALLYMNQSRLDDAEPLLKKAIAIGEKALPADHPDLATWYNDLAALYQKQSRLNEAEQLFKKAIAIGEKSPPAYLPDLATRYNNLAALYQDQDRLDEAEQLFKKAIAIDEKALPADHPALATDYGNLAALHQKQGRLNEAEPLFKKAIAIGEKALPADHPDLATWYNNLAALYVSQSRHNEATALLKKAAAINEPSRQSKP